MAGSVAEARLDLRWFVTAVALLFGICAVTVGFFWAAIFRYEVDFLPALLLLAVVGILGLERALAPTSESGLAGPAGLAACRALGLGPAAGLLRGV